MGNNGPIGSLVNGFTKSSTIWWARVRLEAWLVVKGYILKVVINYQKTFLIVGKMVTIRTILVVVIMNISLSIKWMSIIPLFKEIYMKHAWLFDSDLTIRGSHVYANNLNLYTDWIKHLVSRSQIWINIRIRSSEFKAIYCTNMPLN